MNDFNRSFVTKPKKASSAALDLPAFWLGKPYYSLDAYCKKTYGEKLYKIALNAGLTCPNRDGSLSTGGCIFCSHGGSGDFAASLLSSADFKQALQDGKKRLHAKQTGARFIAYFQAYTNTYGPIAYLEEIYRCALSDAEVAGISIATRPDCLPDEVLTLLRTLKEDYPGKFIWIELGLQTIHESTTRLIRRGYPLTVFDQAVASLNALDIPVIVHLILGLPNETRDDILASVSYLNSLPVWGIKLQLLHILKGTDLEKLYLAHPQMSMSYPDRDSYLSVLMDCLEHLREDIVIHRVTGDAPKSLLIAPYWSADKRGVLNALHQQMKENSSYQGKLYFRKEGFYAGPFNTL